MSPGFDRAPVVTGRDRKRIDAVHDALVVGCSPIWIDLGEIRCDDYPIAGLLAGITAPGQLADGDAAGRRHHGPIGKIRKNPQKHLAAGNRLDERRDTFAHAIDEIGAHGISRIDKKVNDQHRLAARRQWMNEKLDIARAAAASDHVGVKAVREVYDLRTAFTYTLFRCLDVWKVHDLNLAYQDRIGRSRLDATGATHQLGCRAQCGHDGWLFDDHWNDIGLFVDDEIHAQRKRQSVHAHDVFDHLVRGRKLERMLAARERPIVRAAQ